ncbi:hypothetical protein FGE12_24865 [Aggregicoccus sp. 17bor-14]|uniref:hypothetical protein n=1 Tax=Myxococcaceae TaxID=31 RepID=UPI00129CE40E|nr:MULTISPECIES: hypothetical protein [Myxococcaceae]MBF5045662.1 hypothetical protein [Simulacricoccus sp. 17bor-14]MRI91399.1 hypothetical protein [Aggregicoccus sp. 17bor-14]
MRPLVFALLSLAALGASAATPTLPLVFVTVDRYVITPSQFVEVTGLVEGEATPRTVRFFAGGYENTQSLSSSATRCEKLALLAMASPGKFKLELGGATTGTEPEEFPSCALTRVKP